MQNWCQTRLTTYREREPSHSDRSFWLLKTGMVDQLVSTSLQRVPVTQLSNLSGTPSMSVPLHWASAEPGGPELPFGVQFVARFGDEASLLQLAAQLEQAQPWAQRRPEINS